MIDTQPQNESPLVVPDRTLREFAALCMAIFGSLFALSWYRHQGFPRPAAWVGLAVALLIGLPGFFRVGWIRPVFLTATALTRPIGHVMGKVFLGVIYFGMMTPLGWLFRMIGRDPLGLKPIVADSYWRPIVEPKDVRRYLHRYQSERSRPTNIASGVRHESSR